MSAPATTPEPTYSAWQQRKMLLPVLVVVFGAALDLTVVAPILPSVLDDLSINPVNADRYSWIVLAYLLAYTVTVPITGRISDFVGRMPVFYASLVLFMCGSVVVAMADTLGVMIAGRTLQGLGGGAMLPVSMALVADVVPRRSRAAALGIVAAVDTFGWVLGPVWGAAIAGIFDSWRWIFWLNIPMCLGAVVLLLRSPLNKQPRSEHVRPSLLSAAFGGLALLGICLAFSTGGESAVATEGGGARLGGAPNPLADYRWPIFALGMLALVVFVILERRAKTPLLPKSLLKSRVFQVAGLTNVLVGAALMTAMVNAPLVVALIVDSARAPTDTALLLGSLTIAMTVGAVIGGRLVDTTGARKVAVAGLAIAALGLVLMRGWPDTFELGLMAATIAVAGLGLGVVIAPIGEAAVRAARVVDYGAASGLVLLARLLGMTLGLSAITAYALWRLEAKTAALPPVTPNAGESTVDYFARQQRVFTEQVIPLTLDVVRETFLLAAVVCVLALVIVTQMRSRENTEGL